MQEAMPRSVPTRIHELQELLPDLGKSLSDYLDHGAPVFPRRDTTNSQRTKTTPNFPPQRATRVVAAPRAHPQPELGVQPLNPPPWLLALTSGALVAAASGSVRPLLKRRPKKDRKASARKIELGDVQVEELAHAEMEEALGETGADVYGLSRVSEAWEAAARATVQAALPVRLSPARRSESFKAIQQRWEQLQRPEGKIVNGKEDDVTSESGHGGYSRMSMESELDETDAKMGDIMRQFNSQLQSERENQNKEIQTLQALLARERSSAQSLQDKASNLDDKLKKTRAEHHDTLIGLSVTVDGTQHKIETVSKACDTAVTKATDIMAYIEEGHTKLMDLVERLEAAHAEHSEEASLTSEKAVRSCADSHASVMGQLRQDLYLSNSRCEALELRIKDMEEQEFARNAYQMARIAELVRELKNAEKEQNEVSEQRRSLELVLETERSSKTQRELQLEAEVENLTNLLNASNWATPGVTPRRSQQGRSPPGKSSPPGGAQQSREKLVRRKVMQSEKGSFHTNTQHRSPGSPGDEDDPFQICLPATDIISITAMLLALQQPGKRSVAAKELRKALETPGNEDLALQAGAVRVLLSVAGRPQRHPTLRLSCLQSLLMIVRGRERSCEEVSEAGGFQTLAAILEDTENSHDMAERVASARILSNSAEHAKLQDAMVADGAVRSLVYALDTDWSGDEELAEACSTACAHLSSNENALLAIRNAGGEKVLLQTITNAKVATQSPQGAGFAS